MNTSKNEPLVVAVRKGLRYFGPEVSQDALEMGADRKNKFN